MDGVISQAITSVRVMVGTVMGVWAIIIGGSADIGQSRTTIIITGPPTDMGAIGILVVAGMCLMGGEPAAEYQINSKIVPGLNKNGDYFSEEVLKEAWEDFMTKRAKPEQEMMWARHEVDDETGRPYWYIWAEGDKDGDPLGYDQPLQLSPTCVPPGSRVIVLEPDMDTAVSQAFYKAMGNGKDYYKEVFEEET